MRRALACFLTVFLVGCVPTADFRDLRDEFRQLQAENKKLKERLEHQDQGAKLADVVKNLEALDAKVNGLRIEQQGLSQKLGEMLRQAEEAARRAEAMVGREGESPRAPGQVAPNEPKAEPSDVVTPKAGELEPQAALAPTAMTPTVLYNQAYNDYLRGNYDLAIAGFGDLLKRFPGVSQSAHARYWIGRSYYNKKDYRPAIEAYERMIAVHPKNDKVPAALFEVGLAHAALGDAAKAREHLKQVIEKYPQSNEASRARLKLADLK